MIFVPFEVHDHTVFYAPLADRISQCRKNRSDPWVEKSNASFFEIDDVTGDDCHGVDKRSRSKQAVTFGLRVWYMERGTPHGDFGVDRADARSEERRVGKEGVRKCRSRWSRLTL